MKKKTTTPAIDAAAHNAALAQRIREALKVVHQANTVQGLHPSEANEAALFEACKGMARLIPILPAFIAEQDGKVMQLIGLAIGVASSLPKNQRAILDAGLIEIAPQETRELRDQLKIYGGKVAGNA